MRKLLCAALIIIFFPSVLSAQRFLKFKLPSMQKFTAITSSKSVNTYTPLPFKKNIPPYKRANRIICFIESLSQIKLKEIEHKASFSFSAEFSFSDMIESIFENANTTLINTYDDGIAELFTTAPFMLKLKCSIRF